MAARTINRSIIFARNAAKGSSATLWFFRSSSICQKENKKWRSCAHCILCITHILSRLCMQNKYSNRILWRVDVFAIIFAIPLTGRAREKGLPPFIATPGEVMGVQRGCESWVERESERTTASTPQCLCNILRVQWVIQLLAQLCAATVPHDRWESAGVSAWDSLRPALRASHTGSERGVRPFSCASCGQAPHVAQGLKQWVA